MTWINGPCQLLCNLKSAKSQHKITGARPKTAVKSPLGAPDCNTLNCRHAPHRATRGQSRPGDVCKCITSAEVPTSAKGKEVTWLVAVAAAGGLRRRGIVISADGAVIFRRRV
jgi:hypothetical protein